jgi:gliding motility-associated-like protein
MPNIITPNGDGQNDFHVPIESTSEDENHLISRIAEINYSVRNRWGILIHDSKGIPSWDGRNQISGEEAPPGTYFWVLHYKDASGGDFKSNGYVQLSR